jgi:hypothetical protein
MECSGILLAMDSFNFQISVMKVSSRIQYIVVIDCKKLPRRDEVRGGVCPFSSENHSLQIRKN